MNRIYWATNCKFSQPSVQLCVEGIMEILFVFQVDDYGNALHCASWYNNVDVVQELTTRYGADVNQQTAEVNRSTSLYKPVLHAN